MRSKSFLKYRGESRPSCISVGNAPDTLVDCHQNKHNFRSQEMYAIETYLGSKKAKEKVTLERSFSHSPPTPKKAWTPWTRRNAPRGPVLIDVWTISSTSLGKFSILPAIKKHMEINLTAFKLVEEFNEGKVVKFQYFEGEKWKGLGFVNTEPR